MAQHNDKHDENNENKKKKYVYKPTKETDLIELVAYLYANDSAKIENELTRELSKSRRTIYRMTEKINIYNAISFSLDSDFKTILKFNHNLNNKSLEHSYTSAKKFPKLYVFLKGILKKEHKKDIVKLADIKEWLSCGEKMAITVRNDIMNSVSVTDYEISDDDPLETENE